MSSSNAATPDVRDILLSSIAVDGSTQLRAAGIDQDVVNEYEVHLAVLPPIDLFSPDGVTFLIADGWHRFKAHARVMGGEERATIRARVHIGGKRDALRFALSANARHGLRRTNEDKRVAVKTALSDPEWAAMSDAAVAQLCAVSDRFVAKMRCGATPNGSESPTMRRGLDGRAICTAKIGRAAPGTSEEPRVVAVRITQEPVTPRVVRANAVRAFEAGDLRHALEALAGAEPDQLDRATLETARELGTAIAARATELLAANGSEAA